MIDSPSRSIFSGITESDITQTSRTALVIAFGTVLLAGFLLRYLLLDRESIINGDGIFYVWRAQTLMTGDLWNGVSAYWAPLYSFLIGLVGYPIHDFEMGGRIISLVAGTLLIPLTYYFAAMLYDRGVGLIAALLVAMNVPLLQASVWVMTEALYGVLFLGMVITGWLALDRKKIWYWVSTGLLMGLAYLTKPEALGFLLLFFLFTLIVSVFDRTNARKLILGFAIMSGVIAACVAPYVIFVHAKVGEWTVSKKTSTNTLSGVDENQQLVLMNGGRQTIMDELWGDEYLDKSQNDLIAADAAGGSSPTLRTKLGWAYRLFRRQVEEFVPALLSLLFLPLIVIGLFAIPWTRNDASRNVYIAAFVVATFVGYSLAVTNIRYLLAVLPLLLILTAHGMVVLAKWTTDTLRKISEGRIRMPNSLSQALGIVALIVLSTPAIVAKFTVQDGTGTPIEEQRAGLWLRSHVSGGSSTVMSPSATVAYYAGARHLFLPDEQLDTIIDYAKRRQTNFVVFSSRRLPRNKHGFPEVSPEQDLELVYSDDEGGEKYSVRIYKVRQ